MENDKGRVHERWEQWCSTIKHLLNADEMKLRFKSQFRMKRMKQKKKETV